MSNESWRPRGVGGLPIAFPFLGFMVCTDPRQTPEGDIRHPKPNCFCDYPAGPDAPLHWFQAGDGWVGHYFYDVVPFDWNTRSNGVFKCQVVHSDRLCDHLVANDGAHDGTCCWTPRTTAVQQMIHHLNIAHGITQPDRPPAQWKTGLFDTTGCLEVCCCSPCNASRQMMAVAGHGNNIHRWWCCMFSFLRPPPAIINPCFYGAIFTRFPVARLQGIDESLCKAGVIAIFCSVCSQAQTYRELSAAGIWPGGSCSSAPPIACDPPRQPQMGGRPLPRKEQGDIYGRTQDDDKL